MFYSSFFNGVIILWCLILLMSYFYIINLINLKLYTRINCLSYSCSRAPDLLKAVQQVWGWAEFGVDFDFHHTLWSICILSHLWCRCSVQIIFQLLPLGVAPSHPTPRFLLSHEPSAWPSLLPPWTFYVVFLVSSCLAALDSASFVQYIPQSLHCACPEHLRRASLTLSPSCSAWAIPLIY